MVSVQIDPKSCTACGLCVDLCPLSVLELASPGVNSVPEVKRPEACCACMTCSGKCPQSAIRVAQNDPPKRWLDDENESPAILLSREEETRYKEYASVLDGILKLRWKPVAVTLIQKGEPFPHVPVPRVKLRYCQSLIMARRGKQILMPPSSHACPDGTSILGLTKIPPKLASGDIYTKLGKLASKEAAQTLVNSRSTLPEESIRATLVTPLDDPVMRADIVVIMAPPETMMWLSMASTYFTGKRMNFQMGSYNAQCLETTVYPYTTREINLSLGCYGCRAISDLSDDLMFMGIPLAKTEQLIAGLTHLGQKAIPDARSRTYLPPLI
jgi:uncharacterized protein (DUF169 family)/NAD-dependent dihydropyrimidine dehydrogenase PreA subunit